MKYFILINFFLITNSININAQQIDNITYTIHCKTWKCLEVNKNKDAIIEGYFRKYTPEKKGKGANHKFWDWEILLSDSIAVPVKSIYNEINYSFFENKFVQVKGLIFFGIIIGGENPDEQKASGYRIDPVGIKLLNNKKMTEKKKVTGIGGIFFKSKSPEKMREWYKKNLGFVTNEYGSMFESRDNDKPDKSCYLQWSPFAEKTNYFQPSEKEFMINYRVENIEELVDELRKNGVTILDKIEVYEYGKFVHIMDLERNKIELWEPEDSVFDKLYNVKTTH